MTSEFHFTSGEPITAVKLNRIADRGLAVSDPREVEQYSMFRPNAICFNNTGRNYSVGEIFQASSYIGPTSNLPYEARKNLILSVAQPAWHTAISRPCVAAEPIPNNEYGWVWTSGQAIIRTANSADNESIQIDPSVTYHGQASTGGFARMIARLSSSYVVASIGDTDKLWRYELTQNSQFPSTTTAKLRSLDGAEFSSAINLSDPLGIGSADTTGYQGYCVQAGNEFHIAPGPC